MKHKARKAHAHSHPRKHSKTTAPKAHPSRRPNTSVWDETMRVVTRVGTRRVSPTTPPLAGEFTAGELGAPDADRTPDERNPLGVQGGRGPLNQEGEGNRQNDELAELEQQEADQEEEKGERRA